MSSPYRSYKHTKPVLNSRNTIDARRVSDIKTTSSNAWFFSTRPVRKHVWLFAVLGALILLSFPSYAHQVHVVSEGQTLGKIAKRYNISVEAVCAANKITQRVRLKPGQKLIIPDPPQKRSAKASTTTDQGTPSRPNTSTPSSASDSPQSPASPTSASAAATSSTTTDSSDTSDATTTKPKLSAVDMPYTTHIVAEGHTLGRIAQRYQSKVELIIEANKLEPRRTLRVGSCIVVPLPEGVPRGRRAASLPCGNNTSSEAGATSSKNDRSGRVSTAHYGIVHLDRDGITFRGKLLDSKGQPIPAAAKKVDSLLFDRRTARTHPTSPALLKKITEVSNHFGGRRIIVVSGYREESSNRYTAHSNHALGRAIDFRVEGVSNEAIRDYCHTLTGVGVGYYPNSSFVHMDVRATVTHWTDVSGPGEAPRYTSMVAPQLTPKASAKPTARSSGKHGSRK